MKNDMLKTLAMRAKNRMINKNLRNTYSNADIKIIKNTDDDFIAKVRALMSEDNQMCNPLKRLMDSEKMLRMDARGKEKYLLDTIEKYQSARKLIENEQNMA